MAMMDSDANFQQVFDHLGFVCVTLDKEMNVLAGNAQAAMLFGRSTTDLQGRPFLELLAEPNREAASRLILHTFDRGEPGEMEVKYEREDEKPSTFVLIASPIKNQQGAVCGASISMRDISERKRLSRELSKSRRMASLGKVAEAVAHLFNNILGGMQTSIDSALPSDSPRELRKTLRQLSQSIGRATRITQHLAAFAESENAVDEAVELRTLMATFIEKARGRCEKSGIELITNVHTVPSVEFDGNRLLSVLDSLATNALEAMSEGGTLTVEMSHDDEFATIGITDTGCGMSDETQEHLFEPFFTTKGGFGGQDLSKIGLGLATVHGMVAEMGGAISIDSKLGRGTSIHIKLPLHRKESDELDTAPDQTANAVT